MRFLLYDRPGLTLPAHVDLARTDPDTGVRSTHTFILYLEGEGQGDEGATALLRKVNPSSKKEKPSRLPIDNVLAVVTPKRGRLLVFPHMCPHEGRATGPRKALLRGEVMLG